MPDSCLQVPRFSSKPSKGLGFKILWISARMLDLGLIRYGQCHRGL